MSLKNHLHELTLKHRAMEKELHDAVSHPGTPDAVIADIKRRKVRIKDEMTKIESDLKLAA